MPLDPSEYLSNECEELIVADPRLTESKIIFSDDTYDDVIKDETPQLQHGVEALQSTMNYLRKNQNGVIGKAFDFAFQKGSKLQRLKEKGLKRKR